jgi:hypothetical protein
VTHEALIDALKGLHHHRRGLQVVANDDHSQFGIAILIDGWYSHEHDAREAVAFWDELLSVVRAAIDDETHLVSAEEMIA